MGPGSVRFVRDPEQLSEALFAVKAEACPHCRQTGWLIGHGWLRGYAERDGGLRVRGRRLFCSNRFRRRGCGRTVAVLLADVLPRLVVGALCLFRFVSRVVEGATRLAAWRSALRGVTSSRHAYRLWHHVVAAHGRIASALVQRCPPPTFDGTHPIGQCLAHLDAAGCGTSAFAGFQSLLQRPLLG